MFKTKSNKKLFKYLVLFCFLIIVVVFCFHQLYGQFTTPRLDIYAPINVSYHTPRPSVNYHFNRNGPYITTDWLGRTGNQMFEYAAIYGIARLQKMTPVINKHSGVFNIFRSISALRFTDIKVDADNFRILVEHRPCAFDQQVLGIADNTKFQYYHQSWKYFDHVRDEVRSEFIFKDQIYEGAVGFLEHATEKLNYTLHDSNVVNYLKRIRTGENATKQKESRVTLIGIHIRRGDILNADKQDFGYSLPDVSYFKRATQYFHGRYKNILFILCSDDIPWVKENLLFDIDMVVSEGLRAEEDLALLTLCDHMIITEGSFGWWAAYLIPGEVVYFKDWPKKGSQLDRQTAKADYFLPTWIGM